MEACTTTRAPASACETWRRQQPGRTCVADRRTGRRPQPGSIDGGGGIFKEKHLLLLALLAPLAPLLPSSLLPSSPSSPSSKPRLPCTYTTYVSLAPLYNVPNAACTLRGHGWTDGGADALLPVEDTWKWKHLEKS